MVGEKMKKRRSYAISKPRTSYIILMMLVNVVLPVTMLWMEEFLENRKVLLTVFILCVVILSNYLLIVNPIMNIESVLHDMNGEEEISRRLRKLQKGIWIERTFYQLYEEQRRYVEQEYRSEMLRQEAQLMALQSQMNPHFLYNTLESIRGYAILHGITDVANMTEALAKMSRRMTASNSKMVSLKQEIQLVENYMTIQQFRFKDKFILTTKIEEEVLLENRVLNLLLQPIVENAVVHGVHGKRGQCEINIHAYRTQKRLLLKVQDNGCGISKEGLASINQKLKEKNLIEQLKDSKDHIGIALPNINQRIKLHLGEEYGLNIMSTKEVGTSVEVILPLLSSEEEAYEV
jgi:Predicted signal transduction protein with a C-terminal ATPase domain